MSNPLDDGFLLASPLARELYARVQALPIIDYHSHLPVDVLASNKPFTNLTDVWIRGDHYKWRAMRLNGIPEAMCSGSAGDFEKFQAWAATAPYTLRNPLHHWNRLELRQSFGIARELTPATAQGIWDEANALLQTEACTPRGLLAGRNVRVLCTTDDPADVLTHHAALRADESFGTAVYPTFRPDAACALHDAAAFNTWLERLRAVVDLPVTDLAGLLDALQRRHADFHDLGCRVSDHGLESIDAVDCSGAEAAGLFDRLLRGEALSGAQLAQWRSFLMQRFAEWNHARGWVMMLHLGALRNNNSRIFARVGLDTGCDSIGDFDQARGLNRFLDALDRAGKLPKTILFNSNPGDNLLFATIAGNFFEDGVPGKVQYGPAWWFLDTAGGMLAQFDALSAVGLAQRFVGMVTDSRSFLSFSRHDYFRRLMCNLFASEALAGLVPSDVERLGGVLEAICHGNAAGYFNWERPAC
ncbi:glucuronate isomerase [Roseateles asaccharophilus]|uniref:Uronate isomerase n=1 Tax=Roseateles asaccharophilus TaxID=582607 RepID=A0ABU2A9Q2_9BURK|nr:glucuronate isomerase [Roseateles asaccharophilus]MDR7333936.1 glucuronate isomerase [Roseateles asaccharophilus]